MSLDIADKSTVQTTTQSWSLQTFDVPFEPSPITGFAQHGDGAFTGSQYLQVSDYSSRLPRTPYRTVKYDSATLTGATLFHETMTMRELRSMIRNVDFMKAGYIFFSARLMYRFEIIGGPNYQGLLAYSAMSGLVNGEARIAAIPFVDPADSTDDTKMRRICYQNPALVTVDRTCFIDVPVELQFPFDSYWTSIKEGMNDYIDTYKMGSIGLWALNPMLTESSNKQVTINIWRYLVDVTFDGARTTTSE